MIEHEWFVISIIVICSCLSVVVTSIIVTLISNKNNEYSRTIKVKNQIDFLSKFNELLIEISKINERLDQIEIAKNIVSRYRVFLDMEKNNLNRVKDMLELLNSISKNIKKAGIAQ